MARGTKKRYFKKNKTRNNKKIRKQRRMKHSNKSIKRKQIKKSRKRKAVGGITAKEKRTIEINNLIQTLNKHVSELHESADNNTSSINDKIINVENTKSKLKAYIKREKLNSLPHPDKLVLFGTLKPAFIEANKALYLAKAAVKPQEKKEQQEMHSANPPVNISPHEETLTEEEVQEMMDRVKRYQDDTVSVSQRPPTNIDYSEFWDTENRKAVGDQ